MKKILVTGGCGYVGSMLVPELLKHNYDVTVLDLEIYGNQIKNKYGKAKYIKGDIRDPLILKNIIPGNDAVMHLACISNDPSFELNPELGKSINYSAFEPLVKISKNSGVKRFIYASSSSVYGIKKEKEVSEDMKLEPLTDYSKYKALCEDILHKYSDQNFITTTIRPATVCGFSYRLRLDVVVNLLTNLAYHKKIITVYGGDQLRPNIHINDMVKAYIVLLEANKNLVQNQIFNAGYENQTVNEISLIVKSIIGDEVKIIKNTSDDNRSYHISSKKIYNTLNFKAKNSIEHAVLDLKSAFDNNFFTNTLTNPDYFNIKKMQNINLI